MESENKISYILKVESISKEMFQKVEDENFSYLQNSLAKSMEMYKPIDSIENCEVIVYNIFNKDDFFYLVITIEAQDEHRKSILNILKKLNDSNFIKRLSKKVFDTKTEKEIVKYLDLDENNRNYIINYFVKKSKEISNHDIVKKLLSSACEDLENLEENLGCSKLYSLNSSQVILGDRKVTDKTVRDYNLITTVGLGYKNIIDQFSNTLTQEAQVLKISDSSQKMEKVINMKFDVSRFDTVYLFMNPIKANRLKMYKFYAVMESSLGLNNMYTEFLSTFNSFNEIVHNISDKKDAQKAERLNSKLNWIAVIFTIFGGIGAIPTIMQMLK